MGRLTRPVLTAERLRLEPLGIAHAAHVVALDADPEVMRHITGHALTADESHRELPTLTRDLAGLGCWVGFLADDFVGVWCVTRDAEHPDWGELTFRLAPPAWGRGLAAEGSQALLRHAFLTVGLDRVRAETLAVHTRARSVLERLGMGQESVQAEEGTEVAAGREQGDVVYAIDAATWSAGQGVLRPRRTGTRWPRTSTRQPTTGCGRRRPGPPGGGCCGRCCLTRRLGSPTWAAAPAA